MAVLMKHFHFTPVLFICCIVFTTGCKEVESLPLDAAGTYRIVGFSRVAFNRVHTEALFAISDSCGGLCGGGGARLARRENGKWTFRTTVCNWIY